MLNILGDTLILWKMFRKLVFVLKLLKKMVNNPLNNVNWWLFDFFRKANRTAARHENYCAVSVKLVNIYNLSQFLKGTKIQKSRTLRIFCRYPHEQHQNIPRMPQYYHKRTTMILLTYRNVLVANWRDGKVAFFLRQMKWY